ncbi:hypothetical protein GGR54DRAFT_75903 [Hypoxylon sp. NC1633]|nr:hypothetical protein GGR54DRAFT_75903 [Hypoxylon sp. NC1633]
MRSPVASFGSPTFFGGSIQDDEDGENEWYNSQELKDQANSHRNKQYTTGPNNASMEASPSHTYPSDTFLTSSPGVRAPKMPRKKNQSVTAYIDSATAEPPALSRWLSQQTTYSDDSNSKDTPYGAFGTDDLQSLNSLPSEQLVEEEVAPRASTTKRNRFLQRNRVAATKCRQKKKEWVSDLEETRLGLESQNNHLQMEYSNLKNEITYIKAQLMEHATCNDINIDKWIENEAKRFVLGTGERYDQILASVGNTPTPGGMVHREESFASASGYIPVPASQLISPVLSSYRDNVSFASGGLIPDSAFYHRPSLASNVSKAPTGTTVEDPYPTDPMSNSMNQDTIGFDSVPMTNDTFHDSTIPIEMRGSPNLSRFS